MLQSQDFTEPFLSSSFFLSRNLPSSLSYLSKKLRPTCLASQIACSKYHLLGPNTPQTTSFSHFRGSKLPQLHTISSSDSSRLEILQWLGNHTNRKFWELQILTPIPCKPLLFLSRLLTISCRISYILPLNFLVAWSPSCFHEVYPLLLFGLHFLKSARLRLFKSLKWTEK